MRFLIMHRLDERCPEWNPSQEFIEKMGAFVQGAADSGVLITGEGVHPSAKGALVRKPKGAATSAISATDGPFAEAKEVIGGFLLINATDRADAVAFGKRYADMFEEVEVEVRQVVEVDELPNPV